MASEQLYSSYNSLIFHNIAYFIQTKKWTNIYTKTRFIQQLCTPPVCEIKASILLCIHMMKVGNCVKKSC